MLAAKYPHRPPRLVATTVNTWLPMMFTIATMMTSAKIFHR